MPHAIVTGAGSGIGSELAISLARHSIDVTLVGRNRVRLEETQSRIAGHSQIVIADLAQPTGIDEVSSVARREFGPVDYIIHNAGILQGGALESVASPEQSLHINLLAPIRLTQNVLDDLVERSGSVVFIASTAASVPFPFTSLYCGTKRGLVGFAESLRFELHEKGVHVMVAYPPLTATPMTDSMARTTHGARIRFRDPARVAAQIVEAMLRRKKRYWGALFDRTLDASARHFPRTTEFLLRMTLSRFRAVMTATKLD